MAVKCAASGFEGAPAAASAWAELRFYEELNDFLPPALRKRSFAIAIDRGRSVKDAVEAAGVPHTEVDLILVDGEPVGFDRVLRGGERVAVYPVFERLDIAPLARLRPRPLRDPRFVADTHLGKLARHLRLAGFDCLWRNDYDDGEIVALAVAQKRIVLSRDKGLLKRRAVERGHFVRAIESEAQLREVVRAFQLEALVRPFTRCRICNEPLRQLPRSRLDARVPEAVRAAMEEFHECPSCTRVYWRGSHYERLCRMLQAAAAPQ